MFLRLAALLLFLAGLGVILFDDTPEQQTIVALLFAGLAAWVLDTLVGDRLR